MLWNILARVYKRLECNSFGSVLDSSALLLPIFLIRTTFQYIVGEIFVSNGDIDWRILRRYRTDGLLLGHVDSVLVCKLRHYDRMCGWLSVSRHCLHCKYVLFETARRRQWHLPLWQRYWSHHLVAIADLPDQDLRVSRSMLNIGRNCAEYSTGGSNIL